MAHFFQNFQYFLLAHTNEPIGGMETIIRIIKSNTTRPEAAHEPCKSMVIHADEKEKTLWLSQVFTFRERGVVGSGRLAFGVAEPTIYIARNQWHRLRHGNIS